jgi:hypothetical protein
MLLGSVADTDIHDTFHQAIQLKIRSKILHMHIVLPVPIQIFMDTFHQAIQLKIRSKILHMHILLPVPIQIPVRLSTRKLSSRIP